ncbi:hypothetical protein FDP41_001672 [Naegleria fowleri]|uniref:Cyclic nucleotide-binding domain-containing protein n=1 Tax=Naegleria fowleri TaxID=5763 RepID=A0A6A5C258_NAEFO|nr:uncharacterized protein FDP41_001672 [Naegleria fowleri]KAF0979329.1 hypothetical protein FDP41_001672 [Naegleria fowleri]CAG4708093.1 unnamed protein product [Naegleria fowleri]
MSSNPPPQQSTTPPANNNNTASPNTTQPSNKPPSNTNAPPSNTPPKKDEQKKVVQKLGKLVSKFKINPEGKFKLGWDVFILIMCMYNWGTVAYRCSLYKWDYYWIAIDLVVDIILWLDVLSRFRITYLEFGLPVTDAKAIAKIYVKSFGFYVDVLANLPFEFIGYWATPRFWVFYRMNRYLRVYRYNEMFNTFEEGFSFIHPAYMKLIKYILLFIIAHWCVACLYLWVLETEGNPSPDFMLGDIADSDGTQILRAIFWAVGQMNGYANTNPITDFETWCMLVVTVIGLCLYVAIVGTVGAILGDLNAQKEVFENFIDAIKAFMNYRKLSSDLQGKVIEYYTYLWKTRKTLDENQMLDELPEHLKIEVSLFLNKDIIQKIPFFQHLEEQFINSLVLKLKPKVALPNSLIVRKGDIGREMFFINRGSVEVIGEPNEEGVIPVFATLSEGQFFGEMAIINNTKRGASIRAKGYCDLSVLTKEDFKFVMETFPETVREEINVEVRKRQAPPPSAGSASRPGTANQSRPNTANQSSRPSTANKR